MKTKLVRSILYGALVIGAVVAGGLALPVRGQETAPAQKLVGPMRLEAGGSPIDTELGAAAPCLGDFDGDGRVDLLVGQADGKLRVFLNRGGNEQPRFDDFQWFKAGAAGDAGQVTPSPDRGMIGGAVGFVPQLVDFDGDGRDDILSCTGNGAIVVFRRQPGGTFAEGESLKRDDGLEILGTPGCSVHAGDWDGDGDLDLCLAVQRGGLSLVRNTAGRQKPIYGKPEAFKSDGDPLSVRSGNAAPVLADWDGDGPLDLIVGAGDGSVTFYRHTGDGRAATVAEGEVLVPPFFFDEEDHEPKPGRGAHPCVCDFNGDGRLDLMVGSVWTSIETPEVTLTDQEREHDAALEKKLSALSKKFSVERQAFDRDSGPEEKGKRLDGLRVISNQMRAMRRELNRPPPKPIITPHGQVWVYGRQ